jgi:hypothetical protein
MQEESKKEEHRIFDQMYAECCQCKVARRKISEAMRRVRCWFNKEFSRSEMIPKEFEQFQQQNDQERVKQLWNKFL